MDDKKTIELHWGEPKSLIECARDWMATAPVESVWNGPGIYAWVDPRDGLIYIGMARKSILVRQAEHYKSMVRGGCFIVGLAEHFGYKNNWIGFGEPKKKKPDAYNEVASVISDKQKFLRLVDFAFDYCSDLKIYGAPHHESWLPATIAQIEAQLIYDFCSTADADSRLQNKQGRKCNPGFNFKWEVTGPRTIRSYFRFG